ncbi:hypothetical protein GCM10011349_21440 [Novosphingobium indicum]|uniref:Secreted protein n=1 Tax=Novosphingobium indicum TaxID=462949 RepID=A0ABQ2JQT3_9SPHN|nr:hypothetical protein [Novosphingobium indicum]GGN50119.1 hypothetical protein GCM10011349_21440 [Novosphingobium indicum]
MKFFRSRTAASLAALAAFSMTATPVFARGYDRWGRHHHHHRNNGIDGGDVLAGLLIVGGIAAIASAASKSNRDKARDEQYRYPGGPAYDESDARYDEAPPPPAYGESSYPGGPQAASGSFDAAVDACADELERGERRIGSVDNVRRYGERYSVEGQLEDGRGYACSVDDSGQIRSVAVDGRALT